jgi:putative MFS transporter
MSMVLDRRRDVLDRLEQVPIGTFLIKLRLVVGVATFFDLFDAIMIASVLPALIGPWGLAPSQIGALISAAYVGQFVGALFFGWLAGRIGRRPTILVTTLWFALGSLAVAGAWDYQALFWLRMLQGIGLGGEVPVASAYLSEWVSASRRGAYVTFFELTAPVGVFAAALLGAWVVPEFGWRWMFVIGALPALLVFPLRRKIPESPRYLLRRDRVEEAEQIVGVLPSRSRGPADRTTASPEPAAPASWLTRFGGVGVLWFACYFVNYGLTGWLPSIYRGIYHLDVSSALRYGLATSAAGVLGAALCGVLIDRVGRRNWFVGAFLAAAAPLLVLAAIGAPSALDVAIFCSVSYIFVSGCSAALYLYTPEIFPTRGRSLGTGAGSACARVASAIAPALVGAMLPSLGLTAVFLMFGCIGVIGGALAVWLRETAGRRLESISAD